MTGRFTKPWAVTAALLAFVILGVSTHTQMSPAQDTKKAEGKDAGQPGGAQQKSEKLPPAFQKIVDDNKELRDALKELADQHEQLKSEYGATKKALESEISKTNQALTKLDAFIASNNTRIAWRRVEGLQAPDRNRERIYPFAVDFAPDQPISGQPQDLQVVIAGFSYIRGEHDVSHLHGWTQNVRLEGTRVVGEYCYNLSDNDNNSVVNEPRSTLRLLVIAKIKPVQ